MTGEPSQPVNTRWRAFLRASVAVTTAALVLGACAQPGAPTGATQAPTTFQRGEGGTLRLLWWQAPDILNPHLATGTKDNDASRITLEPLAGYRPDGKLFPILAAEIPTMDNGGVSRDGKTVTWKLKQGVKWHDGTEFTADDVVFTYQYMSNEKTAAVSAEYAAGVEKVEAKDKNTFVLTWQNPNPNPYQFGAGVNGSILQKAQFQNFIGERAKDAPGNQKPIGTGPYKVREFKVADVVTYDINNDYHVANQPFFKEVILKGGGDAPSAARAVCQTGDYDFAWNMQIEAPVLRGIVESGGKCTIETGEGTDVERIHLNRANPDPALGENRAEPSTRHPFLSELNVRKALAMAVDRKTIAEQLYGQGTAVALGKATCNILINAEYTSQATANMDVCKYDIAAANKLLDDAGWVRGADGIRAKGGVKMRILYQTSVNALRQKTQDIVKRGWDQLGIQTELKSVPAAVFFSTNEASPDTITKFYADAQMYTSGSEVDPRGFMGNWYGKQVCGKANRWQCNNTERFVNTEYDRLYDELGKEMDQAKRNEIGRKMNDILVSDVSIIPLINRVPVPPAVSKELKGIVHNASFESTNYNISTWHK
jgi:peptide/nickel transport system substrate-binding protein